VTDQFRLPAVAAAMTLLGSLCLAPLFTSEATALPAAGFAGWLFPAVGAVLAVVAAGLVARRAGVPRPLVPVASLVALACYLVVAFARADAVLGLLPGPAALGALVERVQLAQTEVFQYAVPVAPLPGITFLTVLGIAATALLVDTLAVTYDKVALAGVPLLGFYAVPLFLSADGVPATAFALAAAGYLALLLTDARERVGGWGRSLRLADRRDEAVETSPLAQLGRRVGVAVVGLAVVVPLAAPGVGEGLLAGHGPGPGRGPSTVTVINPILNLGDDLRRPEDREVLRYETNGSATYLRIVGLDVFDGESWQASELRVSRDQNVVDGLPRPVGLAEDAPRNAVTTSVHVGALEQKYLPVPPSPVQVDISGEWLYDVPTANIFSSDDDVTTLDRAYTVEHLDVAPTAERLREAGSPGEGFEDFLALPGDLPDLVGETATQVTAEAPTAYDQALALQNYLRSSQFTYTLDAPDDNGGSAIADFLEQRRGYCVQFASAMAIMARDLGIPARVAVGFTAGSPTNDGEYVVGTHDAHAWPELFFPGFGWLAFEPTPATRTGLPPEYARVEVDAPDSSTAEPEPTSSAEAPVPARSAGILRDDELGAGSSSPLSGLGRLPVVPLLLALAALVVLAIPALAGRVARARRWSGVRTVDDDALAGWGDVQATVRDLRRSWPASETPRRSAERLGREANLGPGAVAALHRLAGAVERARYARPGLGRDDAAAPVGTGGGEVGGEERSRRLIRRDAAVVCEALLHRATRGARMRARLLPTAASDAAAAAGTAVADGLDIVDRGVSALGSRLSLARRS
jgi:transglutaminase-like putative cysteine protease